MIVIIDNFDSFTYNLYQSVAKFYQPVKVIRNNEISLSELKKLAPRAIIISPGPGRPEDAGICIDLIKQFASTTPILGVCLGHQSIGAAFGAKVCLASQPIHGKEADIVHHNEGIYQGLPSPLRVGRYHSLIISREHFPDDFVVESTGPGNIIMGVRHRHYPCYGVQFHPESILTPQGDDLIKNFLRVSQCLDTTCNNLASAKI